MEDHEISRAIDRPYEFKKQLKGISEGLYSRQGWLSYEFTDAIIGGDQLPHTPRQMPVSHQTTEYCSPKYFVKDMIPDIHSVPSPLSQ